MALSLSLSLPGLQVEIDLYVLRTTFVNILGHFAVRNGIYIFFAVRNWFHCQLFFFLIW